jgi:hypothetical protein
MVTLRGENRTRIPGRLDPRLGETEPVGLQLPDVPDLGANPVGNW